MLRKIHKVHQGYDSSIRRAQEWLFWPGMQSDIRETCLSCGICSQYHAERPTEPMLSHKIPSRPRSKISVDLFALDGKQYLVMVDHYSDYFKLESLRNVAASTVIRAMKRNFMRHQIPDTCISDNGPQFDSHEFSRFARDYGFALVKSSPSQPWQWESRVCENCKGHFKEITGRGHLYCSAGISQYTSAGSRLFPGTEIDV